MSTVAADATSSKSASKKKKNRTKKKANGKPEGGSKGAEVNGLTNGQPAEVEDDDVEDEGTEAATSQKAISNHIHNEDTLHLPSSPPESVAKEPEQPASDGREEEDVPLQQQDGEEDETEDEQPSDTATQSTDASSRLEAMQQERNNLRDEVTQLRQSLESLQEKHNEEVSNMKEELEQCEQGKEHAETQYRNLLGKVNTIRSQLGERLKEDTAKIEALEQEGDKQREENERLQESMSELNEQMESQASEIETLRSRTNLSTSNWAKERDDLITREAYMREEYEVAKQAMQDWEILATEERARREMLEERATELEEQLEAQREAYERVRNEAETQGSTVDGLQRALRDVQDERKRELREMVEQSQSQLEALRAQSKSAEDAAGELRKQLAEIQRDLDRAQPFEEEVKEKNLLLGKVRHQNVILNEHLVKALRFLKRGNKEDNVDRHLVTNYLLQFLALDRSDAKKFQVLQLIAALLGWSEEQKESAGLVRQGGQGSSYASGSGSLRIPNVSSLSFRRSPSTPSLSAAFVPESPSGTATKESLAELWSEFLEREAEAGSGAGSSRRGSERSPSMASITSPIGGPGGRQSPEMKRKESSSAAGRPGSSGGA
ncbi:hypothetical protein LTR37_007979 [Vermiconidia calcicola]|uniref:Uncharacterized protein n=1 Tax=Vermiconidia calcicola TaxID=1690605 RepID=A0ACC3NC22_9PEZI|nr:hypothetical protein LTR37_007979 [Vermiconidia calcicola]